MTLILNLPISCAKAILDLNSSNRISHFSNNSMFYFTMKKTFLNLIFLISLNLNLRFTQILS